MGIMLGVKCIVPTKPVLEAFELSMCELFEEMLFIGPVTIL